jgi:hypothetical protein
MTSVNYGQPGEGSRGALVKPTETGETEAVSKIEDSVQMRMWALEQAIKLELKDEDYTHDVNLIIEEAQKIANFAMGDGK